MSQQLVIPSLGNPFSLGMLYNGYSETIIPGKSLWDSKVLDSAKKVTQQPSSNFELYAESTIGEKSSSLNVEANLKLSLLGGMIEVGGAAKYLNDEKTSEKQARVTLKYSSTSRFEQLTMEQIGAIQYPKVLDDNVATHVVTGITYGTDAFFVFDRSLTESENIKKISGNMQVAIKFIPISGAASLDMKTKDKEEANKLHCKFYGDLQLPSNPSTFEDAVQVYHELPQLINGKEGDKSTPKVVYLCPLSDLDGGHLRIVRSISNDLVSQVEEIMQNCSTTTMRANDLISHEICSYFVDLESQIKNFQMLVKRFKSNFSKKLCAILPKIRGEGAEESDLAELISSVHKSPFNFKDMEKYLKGKNKEFKQLTQYLENMRKQPKIKLLLPSRDGDLTTLTSDDAIKHVVCFAFNVISDSPAYVDALDSYLTSGKKKAKSVPKEWFDQPIVSAELRSKSTEFLNFVQTNSDVKNFAFAVTDTNEETGASGPAIILYTDGSPEDYELPGKPGTPEATPVDTKSVNLVWTESEVDADPIRLYKVWYRISTSPSKEMISRSTLNAETKFLVNDLSPGTEYEFQVQAVSDLDVCSVKSSSCSGKTKDAPRPADIILSQSKLIERGQPNVYKLPLVLVDQDKDQGLYKYGVGTPPKSTANPKPERVLMVLGATGAGKSTMINGLANYVLGVKFSDTFRYKVVTDEGSGSQAHSQTKTITAYTFYSTILPYTLTVIDTPGFGDTGGITRDKFIKDQIKAFFAGRDRGGIDVLHGIGFVTQSSLARLTPTQKYIFDAVLSIFGKDIIKNIFLMATFADANTPPVVGAVKEANIPFQDCFKFNNSALFCPIDSDGSYFNSMFWDMGMDSFSSFFNHFSRAEMKSLALTREVLKEREQLETLVPGLQVQVKVGLNQMDAIEKEKDTLKLHQKSIMENKDFEYKVTQQKIRQVKLPLGTNTTTCRTCNFTCHDDCIFSDDREKARCGAMSGGKCKVCPKHCHWSNHSNVPYRIEYYSETETKRYDSKKAALDKAETGKQRVERILAEKKQELEDLQAEVFLLIKQVQMSNERLAEIALKPNPLTETDYLELLIESEQTETKPGWQERVAQYKGLIREAEVLKKASIVEIKDRKDKGKSKSMWDSFKSAVGYGNN